MLLRDQLVMTQAELMLILQQELSRHPGLDFALLFGSWARGEARPGSDVDVAIMPLEDWPLAAELDRCVHERRMS